MRVQRVLSYHLNDKVLRIFLFYFKASKLDLISHNMYRKIIRQMKHTKTYN